MANQVVVIGLGQFGMALARALSTNGSEVLAVDVREDHIAEIAPHVADAIQVDAMDEEALARLAPARRDVCICAIGDDNREASIIVTALLRQLGARHIISRATDDLHARILTLVGAHEVIHPERSFGEKLAARLALRNVISMMPLGTHLSLTELAVPPAFVGRTLEELALPRRYGVTVCAVRREADDESASVLPQPRVPLRSDEILVVVSTPDAIRLLTEQV